MADRYTVISTRPDIQPVGSRPAQKGQTIAFVMHPYEEDAEVFVPDEQKSEARQIILDHIKWRDSLED